MVSYWDVLRNIHLPQAASAEQLKNVFDLKGSTLGLSKTVCKKRSSCPLKVFLYSIFGLHRYNLLKGAKFEVSRVNEFIKTTHSAASCYYITLDAKEPPSSPQTFQIEVSEESVGKFILSCTIARIRGETNDDKETTSVYIPGKEYYLLGKHLPEWPQENPFEKYGQVKESELQDNEDWIHLYLELAVATSDLLERKEPKDYDEMVIVDVATDEGINAKNATLYIRFKDLYRACLGKNYDVDRVAIVRRRFDEDTGCFSLEGQILSTEEVIPKKP